MTKLRRKLGVIALVGGVLGVIFGLVVRESLSEYFRKKPEPPAQGHVQLPPKPEKIAPKPEEVAKPHLKSAEEKCERAIDEHIETLDHFFTDSKKNTRAFADEAMSLASKWQLIVDHIPYTSGGRHEKYIREKFEEFVFKPSQLEKAVKDVINGYIAQVQSIEGKMLVDLRTDVGDFPSEYPLAQLDKQKVQTAFDEALHRAMEATGKDLEAGVGTELVSILATEVLTQVAVRLGVSAGILGAGAASGWTTLGAGIAIGLIVDRIVSWVWDNRR